VTRVTFAPNQLRATVRAVGTWTCGLNGLTDAKPTGPQKRA